MKLGFRQNVGLVVATIDCSLGDRRLESGNYGWHEDDVIQWVHGWKLRCQVTLTRKPPVSSGSPAGVVRVSGQESTTLTLEGAVVNVGWVLPDCIGVFKGTHAFGSVGQWSVSLLERLYYCQARIIAQNPNVNATLKLTAEGLEFHTTHLGLPRCLGALNWRLAVSERDPREAARKFYGLS